MINGFEDAQKVGRESVAKAMASFSAVSRSWQTLASETAGYSKQSFEDGAAHVEKLLGAKSIEVAFEAQSDFLRSSYEKAVGQAARFGELYLDLVKEAAKPFEALVATAKK
jgi:phasin family protein